MIRPIGLERRRQIRYPTALGGRALAPRVLAARRGGSPGPRTRGRPRPRETRTRADPCTDDRARSAVMADVTVAPPRARGKVQGGSEKGEHRGLPDAN